MNQRNKMVMIQMMKYHKTIQENENNLKKMKNDMLSSA